MIFAIWLPNVLTLVAVVHPRSRRLGLIVAAACGWIWVLYSIFVVLPAALFAYNMNHAFHDPSPAQNRQFLLILAFPVVQFLLALAAGGALHQLPDR